MACGRGSDGGPGREPPAADDQPATAETSDDESRARRKAPHEGAHGEPAIPQPTELGWPLPLVDVEAGGRGEVLSLRARPDDLVTSVAPGVVTAVGLDDALGRTVSIEHGGFLVARYGGLGEVLVHEGLSVERGTAVGVPAVMPHGVVPVLLELRVRGHPVDALMLLGSPPHDVPTLATPPAVPPAGDDDATPAEALAPALDEG